MSIKYLTDAFLARLRNAIPQNEPNYRSPQPWLDEVAAGTRYWRDAGVDIGSLRELVISGRAEDDAENAVVLYSALQKLTPVQAIDERLWTYATHVTYWRYMVARWGADNILDRFFLKGGGIGALVRNGISRLWWAGYLTYDAGRSDPFELTRVLLSKSDIHVALLERRLGKSPLIRRAVLEYFKDRWGDIEASGGWSRVVQSLLRDLNTAGGVYLLDSLTPSQIGGILDSSLGGLAA